MGVLLIRIWGCLFFLFSLAISTYAQHVNTQSIYVSSRSGSLINHANVILYTPDSSIHSYYITDDHGKFEWKLSNIGDQLLISVRALGYEPVVYQRLREVLSMKTATDTIVLKETSYSLQETVIKAKPPAVYTKGDTVVYNLDQLDVDPRQRLEDYLKELDNFQVLEDGTIQFHGIGIKKILLDGTDLTGASYQKISKNINADMIQSIEVINNFEENSVKSKYFKSGEVGLNLKLKESAYDLTGDITGRIGNPDRWASELNALYISKKFKSLLGGKHDRFSESFAATDIGNGIIQPDAYSFNRLASPNQHFKNPLLQDLPQSYRYNDRQSELDFNSAFAVKDHKFRLVANTHAHDIPINFNESSSFSFPFQQIDFETRQNNSLSAKSKTHHLGGEYKWGKKDLKYHRVKVNAIYDRSDIRQSQIVSGAFTDSSFHDLNTSPRGIYLDSEHSFSLDDYTAIFVNTEFTSKFTQQTSSAQNARWKEGLLFADDKGFVQLFDENVNHTAISIAYVRKGKLLIQSHAIAPRRESRNMLLEGMGQEKNNLLQSSPYNLTTLTTNYRYFATLNTKKALQPSLSLSTGASEADLNGILATQLNYSAKFNLRYVENTFKQYSFNLVTERSLNENLSNYYFTYFNGTQSLHYKLEEIRPSISYRLNATIYDKSLYGGYELSGNAYYVYRKNHLTTTIVEDPANSLYRPFYTDLQQWMGFGKINFVINQWLTKVDFSLTYSGTAFDQLVNNVLSQNISHSLRTRLELRKPLGKQLLISAFGAPAYSVFLNDRAPTSTNFFFEGGGKLSWSPNKSLEATAYYKVLDGEVVEKPFHLFDIGMKYKISNTLKAILTCQNLLDYRSYGRVARESFYSYGRFVEIPGRTISVEVSYEF